MQMVDLERLKGGYDPSLLFKGGVSNLWIQGVTPGGGGYGFQYHLIKAWE
jgi:hypothetical protein